MASWLGPVIAVTRSIIALRLAGETCRQCCEQPAHGFCGCQAGSLSWRGEIARTYRGDVYPTHGLGPVSLWMGINRGDRYASMVSVDTGNKGLQSYARQRFGKDHPAGTSGFFKKAIPRLRCCVR